jgi:hypothetical protein
VLNKLFFFSYKNIMANSTRKSSSKSKSSSKTRSRSSSSSNKIQYRLNGIYKAGPRTKHGPENRIGKLIKKNEKMGIFRLNYNGQDFVLPLNSLVTATAQEKRNHRKGTASDTPPSHYHIEKMRTQTPSDYYKPVKPLS